MNLVIVFLVIILIIIIGTVPFILNIKGTDAKLDIKTQDQVQVQTQPQPQAQVQKLKQPSPWKDFCNTNCSKVPTQDYEEYCRKECTKENCWDCAYHGPWDPTLDIKPITTPITNTLTKQPSNWKDFCSTNCGSINASRGYEKQCEEHCATCWDCDYKGPWNPTYDLIMEPIATDVVKGLGESCVISLDCYGHKPGSDSLGCQDGICVQQLKDWAGVYQIPKECMDAPARPLGSCSRGNHWPRKVNEECLINLDCESIPGQNPLGCEDNKCTPMEKDWAGMYYIPKECQDRPFGPAGTCGRGLSWPRKVNEECAVHTDCGPVPEGQPPLGCQDAKCTPMKKDWAGVWYIPKECIDKPAGVPGSCDRGYSWPRKVDQDCVLHTDCESLPGQIPLGCQDAKCIPMKKDWAGIYYIPKECKDGISADPGTCDSGLSWPRKLNEQCNLHTDCEVIPGQDPLGCQDNKCTTMKKDWAGAWYIPKECMDKPAGTPGSCSRGYSWPRKVNQDCVLNTDCESIPGQIPLGCQDAKCTPMVKDWAGQYYNSKECQDRPFGPAGTCNSGLHWPRKLNEQCNLHTDCEVIPGQDPLGCQDNKCTPMKKDWAGVWYIPKECADKPAGVPGSCSSGYSWPRKVNQDCVLHTDCERLPGQTPLGCQDSKCIQMVQGEAGIWWIPKELPQTISQVVGQILSLPAAKKLGETCTIHTDCEYIAGQDPLGCQDNVCVKQIKDWAGTFYIPKECRDGPARPTGTCSSGLHWPRKLNETCSLHTDCEGYSPFNSSLGCQDSKCVDMVQGPLSMWYIPKNLPQIARKTGQLIQHDQSKKCLVSNGSSVSFETCDPNNNNQKWTYDGNLKNEQNGKCLDSAGDNIYFSDCGSDNIYQRWDNIDNMIKHTKSRQCLDSGGSSVYFGGCDASNGYQKWNIDPHPGVPNTISETIQQVFNLPVAKKVGESCTVDWDCESLYGQDPLGCQNNVCIQKKKDWAGNWEIPNVCRDGPARPTGTCSSGNHWPRQLNEECVISEDCLGSSIFNSSLGCQDNKCVQRKKDYAEKWYVPKECKNGFFASPGTCA
jgi:hypothetical protein